MKEQKMTGPGIPSEERIRKGAVACIECFQNIPCNPCEEACSRGAITIGDEITGLPTLDENKCNGCGICMTRCPGLAIFGVDASGTDGLARVSFPYEYVPLPVEGQTVRCVNRQGAYVTDGVVTKVRTAKSYDHTAIVTVEIPDSYVMDVRSIDRHLDEKVDEDQIYVCRCEEVTVGDIRRAIAEGADTLKAIKMRTHAGMGVCQGMTCRKNIERILREEKVKVDASNGYSQRFPVRLLNVGAFTEILEDHEEETDHDS